MKSNAPVVYAYTNNNDFNALNYQHSHFGISSFLYIRQMFNMKFFKNDLEMKSEMEKSNIKNQKKN